MIQMLSNLRSSLRSMLTTAEDFARPFNNVNAAWREGKAIELVRTALDEMQEVQEIKDVTLGTLDKERPSDRLVLTVAADTDRSRLTLSKIMRSVDETNRRYGTHVTVRIIQAPTQNHHSPIPSQQLSR